MSGRGRHRACWQQSWDQVPNPTLTSTFPRQPCRVPQSWTQSPSTGSPELRGLARGSAGVQCPDSPSLAPAAGQKDVPVQACALARDGLARNLPACLSANEDDNKASSHPCVPPGPQPYPTLCHLRPLLSPALGKFRGRGMGNSWDLVETPKGRSLASACILPREGPA